MKSIDKIILSVVAAAVIGVAAQDAAAQSAYEKKLPSVRVIQVDEESMPVLVRETSGTSYGYMTMLSFEHIRVQDSNGKRYRLIYPGQSPYQVGDLVNVSYFSLEITRSEDIAKYMYDTREFSVKALQVGEWRIDGVISVYSAKDAE